MSAHTPGPWKVIEPVALDYRAPLIYGADGGSLVAVAEGGGHKRAIDAAEARANARLIAAAPDLLEALQLHVAYEKAPSYRGGTSGPKGRAWAAFIAARAAAIAKATGT